MTSNAPAGFDPSGLELTEKEWIRGAGRSQKERTSSFHSGGDVQHVGVSKRQKRFSSFGSTRLRHETIQFRFVCGSREDGVFLAGDNFGGTATIGTLSPILREGLAPECKSVVDDGSVQRLN